MDTLIKLIEIISYKRLQMQIIRKFAEITWLRMPKISSRREGAAGVSGVFAFDDQLLRLDMENLDDIEPAPAPAAVPAAPAACDVPAVLACASLVPT